MLDVVVIGAGVSGLHAAQLLHAVGRKVVVLEGRDRVGGRVFTEDGLDHGPTWVWDSEPHVHRLLRELNVATFPVTTDGLDLYDGPDGLQQGRLPRSAVAERRIVGGTTALTTALAERVPDVRFGTPVTAVHEGADGLTVVTPTGELHAAHVLVALPPRLFALTVEAPGAPLDVWRRVPTWMADVAKVVAHYPTRVWVERGLSGRAFSVRGPLSEIHDLSVPDGPAALFGFAHRPHDTPELEVRAAAQLHRLFGERPSRVVAKRWWQDPWTARDDDRPVDPNGMGHPRLHQPAMGGRLHLISCETSAISPGHLDGAVERAEAVVRGLSL